MKTKQPLLIISTTFVLLLACESLAQPVSVETAVPTATQTQAPTSAPTSLPTPSPTEVIIPQYTPAENEIVDDFGVLMALVPEGEFIMGNPNGERTEQKPPHKVYLDSYYIDKFEVSKASYKACVEDKYCSGARDHYEDPSLGNYPLVWVTWEQSQTYCEWRGARLPTEAEWEKAAKGTDGRTYPWGEEFAFDNAFANFSLHNRESELMPVDSFPQGASPYGVYNMVGNVEEWVHDWYSSEYYSISPYENPLGPDTGNLRVQRGGSISDTLTTTMIRHNYRPDAQGHNTGFRCAKYANP